MIPQVIRAPHPGRRQLVVSRSLAEVLADVGVVEALLDVGAHDLAVDVEAAGELVADPQTQLTAW